MNSKGTDALKLVGALIFSVIFLGFILNFINVANCTDEKNDNIRLTKECKDNHDAYVKAQADANYFKGQYDYVRDHNVTKQDIADLNYQLVLMNTRIETINQIITNQTTNVNLAFDIALFTLFDFVILDFKIIKWVQKTSHSTINYARTTIGIWEKEKTEKKQ